MKIEIEVEMKEANRLLGGVCSVADKSLAQPAIDPGKYVPWIEPEGCKIGSGGDEFKEVR